MPFDQNFLLKAQLASDAIIELPKQLENPSSDFFLPFSIAPLY